MSGPRIALIHALPDSVAPIHAAFARVWPEAVTFDLLDSSLSRDLAVAGSLTKDICDRFLTLGRYASQAAGEGGETRAILFTCSAFGPAIEAVAAELPIPVLKPNAAAFEDALAAGSRIGLLVTFEPSRAALEAELHRLAADHGRSITVVPRVVEGALAALQSGDGARHDALIARAAAETPALDALVLGQFSMARAAITVAPVPGRPVFTTPTSAVDRLRALLA